VQQNPQTRKYNLPFGPKSGICPSKSLSGTDAYSLFNFERLINDTCTHIPTSLNTMDGPGRKFVPYSDLQLLCGAGSGNLASARQPDGPRRRSRLEQSAAGTPVKRYRLRGGNINRYGRWRHIAHCRAFTRVRARGQITHSP